MDMKSRVFLVFAVLFSLTKTAFGQTICTINANVNWSACTCVETGLAPVNGNKIVVSATRTLTINVNSPVPFFIGDIDVLGTLIADRNGAQLNGNIRVLSGGTFDLAKKLDLGSSGGCGFTVIIDSGGSLTFSGGGASSLLSVCGNPAAQAGGGCSTFPNGAPPFCGGTLPPGGGFVLDETGNGGINYIWKGTTSNWTTSTNWTPTRTTLTTDDFLTFNTVGNTGGNFSVTNIPVQSIGKIVVTGTSTYAFTSTASNTLTLTSVIGNAFQIDNGSTLAIGNGSFAINITLPSNGLAEIGGNFNLTNGNFGAGNATLTLHTNSAPLARTSGQVSLNSASILNFGSSTQTSGSTIVLPNSIFVSAPTISSLRVNRTNGATLGDQSITVNSAATFTLGDLNTNGSGRLRFATSAANPVETTASKVVGFSEMLSRSVTTGAIDFLGFSLASGVNDVGFVNIVRRTGTGGINTFNSNQSISVSWDVLSTAEPVGGRSLVFRWVSSFDNVTVSTNQYQPYVFSSGPGWTALGTLQNLTATSPLRQTTSVTTTKLSDTFTVTDQTQTLPIELVSFVVRSMGDAVNLEWITASELNNDFFTVERMSEGDEKFNALSTIQGAGTKTTESSYEWIDQNPRAGTSYYRLKQTDFDGKYTYSEVRLIENTYVGALLKLYPNPISNNKFMLELNGLTGSVEVPFAIITMQGTLVLQANYRANEFGSLKASIDLPLLPSGVYIVVVNAPAGLRRKIVIP